MVDMGRRLLTEEAKTNYKREFLKVMRLSVKLGMIMR